MSTRVSISNLTSDFSQDVLKEIFGQFKGFMGSHIGRDGRSGVYFLI